jgi:hypothetical protein
MVFKSTARRVDLLALEPSARSGDPRSQFRSAWNSGIDAEEGDVDDYGRSAGEGEDGETGEAVFGHSPFEPDPSRNVPKSEPNPLRQRVEPKRRKGNRSRSTKPLMRTIEVRRQN